MTLTLKKGAIAIFEFLTLVIGGNLLVSVTPTPALAQDHPIAYTNNTPAAEAWFHRGRPAWIDVLDAKCDAHPVYVVYTINAERKKDHHGGCGTLSESP